MIKKIASITFASVLSFGLLAGSFAGIPSQVYAAEATVTSTSFTANSAIITGKVTGVNDTAGITLSYSLASEAKWTNKGTLAFTGLDFKGTMPNLVAGASYHYTIWVGDPQDGIILPTTTFKFTGAPEDGNATTKHTPNEINITIPLDNPLTGEPSIPAFIASVLDTAVMFMVPIIVIMLLYSGFLFVSAMGDVEKLGTAKKSLLYTAIGAALVLGAKALALFIQSTIACLAGGVGC